MQKKLRKAMIGRASAVAVSFAVCSSLPVFSIEPAMATSVSYTGSNGPAPGQNGQSEIQTLSNTGQFSNYLSVTGGNGADNDGGVTTYNGGSGGNASAIGNETFFNINSLTDTVIAIGGNGGAGQDVFGGTAGTAGTASAMETDTAAGGSVTIQSTAQGGNGGDTINATAQTGGTATAGASTSGDGGSVNITVMSIGGNGGNAQGSGNGGNGGSASFSTINGVSLNSDVTITASLIGGNGGNTNNGNAGGNGASVSVSNGITGSVPEAANLSLTQNATGGNGGSGTYGAGNGGNGSTSLSISASANDLFVTTNGTGGAGGSTEYDSPGQGGNGTANASGTNSFGNVTVGANADGGAVGAFSPFPVGDQFPANGGSASSSATATSTNEFGANVAATATASGAAGATVDPDPNTFNGGNGGNATATATATGTGFFSTLSATATATGGGAGGNDTTHNDGTIGVAGTATAIATVSDGSGTATTTATAGNSVAGETITSTASGSVGGGAPPEFKSYTTSTLAYSAVAQPVSSQPGTGGYQSFVVNTGLPTKSDSQAALAGQPNIQAYFGPGSTVLGLLTLGGDSNGDGVSHTWTSSTTVDFSLATPLSHDLIVGFLDSSYTGNGFDSLSLTVEENGAEIFSGYYSSASAAAAALADYPFDLYPDSGMETLEFDMSLTTSAPGDSFQTSLIYGDGALGLVPEPCGAGLMALSAFALCLRRRRRR
jgi:hypothetical protein